MYDDLRRQMQRGEVDLDYEDKEVREQLQVQTFDINPKGAIQITPKKEMRKAGLESPDELDAVVMAACDLSAWTGNPANSLTAGDAVAVDREEMGSWFDELPMTGPGLPML